MERNYGGYGVSGKEGLGRRSAIFTNLGTHVCGVVTSMLYYLALALFYSFYNIQIITLYLAYSLALCGSSLVLLFIDEHWS